MQTDTRNGQSSDNNPGAFRSYLEELSRADVHGASPRGSFAQLMDELLNREVGELVDQDVVDLSRADLQAIDDSDFADLEAPRPTSKQSIEEDAASASRKRQFALNDMTEVESRPDAQDDLAPWMK
jgi:hypothetical protein